MTTQINAYNCIQIPCFNHFLYRDHECMIDERGVLLIRNEEQGEWIRLNEKEFQLDYCMEHPEDVFQLAAVFWHCDPYLDCDETWETYQLSLRGMGPGSRVG